MALEHVLDLLPRAHEETRAANRKQVAEGVARGELLYPDVRTEEIAKEVDWVSGSLKDGQTGKAGGSGMGVGKGALTHLGTGKRNIEDRRDKSIPIPRQMPNP